jgi:hypothetical protein
LSADFFQFHFPEKVIEKATTVFYISADDLFIPSGDEVLRSGGE